jgi:CRP-like cAMP-binding protein
MAARTRTSGQEVQVNINPLDLLVHFSNVLLLIAFSVRDILWLRWFAVAAALTNVPYFVLQRHILWPPILWGLVFMAINLYQIVRIYLERRPVRFSEDEQTLYDMAFKSLRPREFISLLLAGEWKTAAAGDTIVEEGKPVSAVNVVVSGSLQVRKDGKELMPLKPGYLIGTGLALSGQPSPMAATFTEPARYFSWPLSNLRLFLDERPDLRQALQSLVNRDLAAKLEQLTAYGLQSS